MVGARWAAAPSASFPKMMKSDAELEGLYGLVENDEIDHREILMSHARATRARIEEAAFGREVLVVEDTTIFEFGGDGVRRDMGWVSRQRQGFFAHIALALSADGSARPFGVIGLWTFMRERPKPMAVRPKTKWNGKRHTLDPKREARRWSELADETTEFLRGFAIPIHVTDREADSYAYVAARIAQGQRFVLRARELNRIVMLDDEDGATTKLRFACEHNLAVAERNAFLSRRRRSGLASLDKANRQRDPRIARLEIRAQRVRIPRQRHLPETISAFVDVNVVHVREIDTPQNLEPVEWFLLTSESIATRQDVLRVVDHYRARWTIEELNKAIKTGCQYEARQLESRNALLVALAICIPVAWQMLALRHQSRTTPDAPATTVLSAFRLETLRAIARKPLPKNPSVQDVFFAIAALGGHLKRNGPPGWQTLRSGLDELLIIEAYRRTEKTRDSSECGES